MKRKEERMEGKEEVGREEDKKEKKGEREEKGKTIARTSKRMGEGRNTEKDE